MIKRVILRVLLMLLAIVAVSLVVYFALTYYMMNYFIDVIDFPEYLNISFGLYKDFFITCFVQGDWGYTVDGYLISEIVFPRFWVTLKFIILAMAISIPSGMLLGVFLTYYEGTVVEKILSKVVLGFGSLPSFIIMMMGIAVFGYILHILPKTYYFVTSGRNSEFSGYIIPMITLCSYPIAIIATTLRGELVESAGHEYYTLCRAKGLKRIQIIMRHSLREAMITLMTVIADLVIFILSASFVVEAFYHIPGVGELLYDSLIKIDYGWGISYLQVDVKTTVIITTYYMMITMALLLFKDIATYFIDPRMRLNKMYT